jgi:NNP family nitrate/nitrite transporter-like MFS transporter
MNYLLLALFWILWYLNYASRSILSPLLPVIQDALTLSHAMAGGLYFPFYFGSTFSVLAAGVISLKLGYKKLIFLCFFLLAVSFTALRFARTYEVFIVLSFFLGLGSGLYIPCAIPLITTVFDKPHWGRAISIHETAAGFAILTVPFLVVLALGLMEWYSIFLFMGGASLILMFLGIAFLPDPRPVYEKQYRMRVLLQRVDFWIVTIAFVVLGIASMGIYNIIPLFLVNERGMALDAANTLFGISRVGGFIAMVLIGFILDRFSTKKVFAIIIMLTGITTVALALVHAYPLLIFFLCCQATFSVVFFPAGFMLIAKITEQRERGLFTAIVMSAAGICGPGLSPIFLGALADTWSFQMGILIVGLLTIGSCICLRWLDNV